MRTVVVCFALMAGWGFAQDAPAQNAPAQKAPEKAVRTIRDVQLGMSRDHVLAGLGDKHDLTRVDDPKSELAKRYGDEFWAVWPKDDPQALPGEREPGAIRFWQGKAVSVEISLYRSSTGESTRFAEHLFWLIYNRADRLSSPDKAWDKLDKEYNARSATLPVQLQDRHDDKGEELKLFFTLDGQDFSITVWKRPGEHDSVRVEQNIYRATTEQK